MNQKFSAIVKIIDINPHVYIPNNVLRQLQKDAGKVKGPIPVRGVLNGKPVMQSVVRFRGAWRLYLNTQMRQDDRVDVGDAVTVEVEFDKEPRIVPIPPQLTMVLEKNKQARLAFEKLPPSRQKEINRYLGFLKPEEAVKRNVEKVIKFLARKKTNGVLFR